MEKQLTLQRYLDKHKTFVIPHYQRGYVWGKGEKDNTAVDFMLKSIKEGCIKEESMFLQGITVSEDASIILIDGQQRTTFLYLLLCYLESAKDIEIRYEVRKESEVFLTELKSKTQDEIIVYIARNDKEDYQDIFFFKRTLRYIHRELGDCEKDKLENYLLNNINFLYINIPIDKAIKTFTMMNGSKAPMKPEELIKAEMLRQISIPQDKTENSTTDTWEINALRSRYAREWDKWLYWWNREDVRYIFKTKKQLGWLLECFIRSRSKANSSSFENFKTLLNTSQSTKLHFKELRRLQKTFEDIFNNPKRYNFLGLSLIQESNLQEQYKIIDYFIKNKHNEKALSNFAKWRVVGATHDQILEPVKTPATTDEDDVDNKKIKALEVFDSLSQKEVYKKDGDNVTRRYLLYLNVLEDNKTNGEKGRKFNFEIFDNQSLEHIHPKSKAYHKVGENYIDGNGEDLGTTEPVGTEWLNRDKCPANVSEHSIGNLVLLKGNNNSAFGNETFNEKKNKYFNLTNNFESRELLHTISVFAKEKWGIEEITNNQQVILGRFKEIYNIQSTINAQTNE